MWFGNTSKTSYKFDSSKQYLLKAYLCNCGSDPVHLVPQLAAGGGQAGEGLLQGHAGVEGALLHDLAQPHHLCCLGLKLQLSRHRLTRVQYLLGGQQR